LRTSPVETLIIKPLQAAIDTAQNDLDNASGQLTQTQERYDLGQVTITDVRLAQARVGDKVAMDRAEKLHDVCTFD
jgi:outer membrane protein TolC